MIVGPAAARPARVALPPGDLACAAAALFRPRRACAILGAPRRPGRRPMLPLKDDNPTERTPVVSYTVLGLCVAVFLWQVSLPPAEGRAAVYALGMIPAVLFGQASLPPDVVMVPAAATLFTSMFLHGGWMHLIGNMLYLWIFADNVEDAMGHARFVVFYLVCGLAAAFAQAALDPGSQVPMVGASGAISGVLGAYLLLHPRAHVLVLIPLGFFSQLVRLPALIVLALWFGLQLFQQAMAGAGGGGGVAFMAHIGGFVAGMALIPRSSAAGCRCSADPVRPRASPAVGVRPIGVGVERVVEGVAPPVRRRVGRARGRGRPQVHAPGRDHREAVVVLADAALAEAGELAGDRDQAFRRQRRRVGEPGPARQEAPPRGAIGVRAAGVRQRPRQDLEAGLLRLGPDLEQRPAPAHLRAAVAPGGGGRGQRREAALEALGRAGAAGQRRERQCHRGQAWVRHRSMPRRARSNAGAASRRCPTPPPRSVIIRAFPPAARRSRPMQIIVLSGSLRSGSYNTCLAHALAELAPEGCDVEVATPRGVPVYDGDVEADEGIPDAVAALKDRVAAADGLVLVTPEYNQGVPGPFKNAIDWMTRPPKDIARVFRGKPVALCGATPGGAGTRSAQYAWLPTLRTLGTRLYSEHSLLLARAGELFDTDGRLVDQDMRERAAGLIHGLCTFARHG
ncbi:MAG: rhomboid family intramembrane serine protease [Halofilum sp. (in: g-proteobacteria)]|nr:rhomboid family intramembrane serine protease [Halofilum sp. (in: g-proteobacteria)]